MPDDDGAIKKGQDHDESFAAYRAHCAGEGGQLPLLLIVDSNQDNLQAMQNLLGSEHWQVACSLSGEEALHHLEKEDVSLILLAVKMPLMNGYEVAQSIRTNAKTRYTPIIFFIDAAKPQEEILQAYSFGAIDFIATPFDPTFLHYKIHNLLGFENNRRALLRLNQQLERDIEKEQKYHQQLQSLIVSDPLTSLLNRRGFHQAAEISLARAKREGTNLALMFMDIDDFKQINDRLGHDAGDDVLRHIAHQLKGGLRPYDTLARMGGDEFTVVLEGLKHCHDAAGIAAKLLQLIAKPWQTGNEQNPLSASLGIACYPSAGEDIETLLQAADLAMYAAKKNGRGSYHFYSPKMAQQARRKLAIEQNLSQAMDRRFFTLVYQPQFYLDDGRLRGFEILLRWEEGNIYALTTRQLIAYLEETDLIQSVGQWILNEALARLEELRHYFGRDIVLSVNLSAQQFANVEMVADIKEILRQYDMQATQLELEITEDVLLHNLDLTQAHLHHLRQLGIGIAIDDFGTGTASLAYLPQFKPDILKIDQSLIDRMLESTTDAAMIDIIIALGQKLGIQVLAKGVEREEQRQWLLEHHCPIMQGYLTAPPLPFEQACRLAAQRGYSERM